MEPLTTPTAARPVTTPTGRDVLGTVRDAFGWLTEEYGLIEADAAVLSRNEWFVDYASRDHVVRIAGDRDGRRIDVTVDGLDLATRVLDLTSVLGQLTVEDAARIRRLGYRTGRTRLGGLLAEQAAVLREHADALFG